MKNCIIISNLRYQIQWQTTIHVYKVVKEYIYHC